MRHVPLLALLLLIKFKILGSFNPLHAYLLGATPLLKSSPITLSYRQHQPRSLLSTQSHTIPHESINLSNPMLLYERNLTRRLRHIPIPESPYLHEPSTNTCEQLWTYIWCLLSREWEHMNWRVPLVSSGITTKLGEFSLAIDRQNGSGRRDSRLQDGRVKEVPEGNATG